MMIFPFPTGTRQMVLQLLQVKYLCSLSAWRALAPALLLLMRHHQFTHFWFSALRLYRFLENMRNRITIIRTFTTVLTMVAIS